jgi:hypothetical protein
MEDRCSGVNSRVYSLTVQSSLKDTVFLGVWRSFGMGWVLWLVVVEDEGVDVVVDEPVLVLVSVTVLRNGTDSGPEERPVSREP